MSFVVITSAETFDGIVDAGEMPHLVALGADIVLVRPLFDELARDTECGAYIWDHSPPFVVVETFPAARVYTGIMDYLTGTAKDRINAGEAGVIVMTDAGQWFVNRRPHNLAFAIAGEGMVDGIRRHLASDGAPS